MSPEEKEFLQLAQRCKNAQEYFKTKYHSDIPEAQVWAEQTYCDMLHRVLDLWQMMSADKKQRLLGLFEEVTIEK